MVHKTTDQSTNNTTNKAINTVKIGCYNSKYMYLLYFELCFVSNSLLKQHFCFVKRKHVSYPTRVTNVYQRQNETQEIRKRMNK